MPLATSRALLRPARTLLRQPALRRFETTTAEAAKDKASSAAATAKEKSSQLASKASEGLSKVQSSAGTVLSKAGDATEKAAGKASGYFGRLQALVPPTIYYSKVGLELSRLVFQGQKMAPPTIAQFQSYLSPLVRLARNPSAIATHAQNTGLAQPQTLLNTVRGLTGAQLAAAAVVAAEVLGFFTVGEMLGKFKIVGYRGKVEGGH